MEIRWFLLFFLTMVTADSVRAAPPPGMIDILTVVPTVKVDLRYATKDNFLGKAFYDDATCYLKPSVAHKVARAEQILSAQGYHLVLWDCVRLPKYQFAMWDWCVTHHGAGHCAGLVANPNAFLSGHTDGTVFDGGLLDGKGNPVELPSKFDSGLFPSDTAEDKRRAVPPWNGVKPFLWTAAAWRHYQVMSAALKQAGLACITSVRNPDHPTEWWHWKG